MRVTAFHLAGKVEEAVKSYFSNSFVFASRTVDVERVVDFRKGISSLQFLLRGDDEEQIPMGGIEFATVQEKDGKVAFQCRMNIQPSGYAKQFFIMMGAENEQYVHYSNLAELLRKQWERHIEAYLPKGSDGMPMPIQEQSVDPDDEYEGLTPEEIEAVTGVRPQPKSSQAPSIKEDDGEAFKGPETDFANDDEIQRLMGMMAGGASEPEKNSGDDDNMSLEQIEALTREAGAGADKDAPQEETSEKDADTMSAEDIWKQISGG